MRAHVTDNKSNVGVDKKRHVAIAVITIPVTLFLLLDSAFHCSIAAISNPFKLANRPQDPQTDRVMTTQ